MISRILVAAALVSCVAEDPDELPEQPQPEQPQPDEPIQMKVSVDWSKTVESGGGFDVTEIAANLFTPIEGGRAVIRLDLSGSVTGRGGTSMKVRINRGTGSWQYAGMSSADYESGACGTWQMSRDSLNGHICTAPPGAPTLAQTATWRYSMAELFDITGTVESYSYTAPFYIQIFDDAREIECRELILDISRSQLGAGSSFDNRPCP
jgi:hypothetical protein